MKILKILISVTFFTLLGILYYSNYRYKSVLETYTEKNSIFREMVILHSTYGGSFTLPHDMVLFDSLVNEIHLKSIFNGDPKLVFRFTSLNCDICYKEVLTILKCYSHTTGGKNIIMLVSFDRVNHVRLIFRDQNLKLPFFMVPFGSIINEAEGLNYPYFFVLNQNGQVSNTFIPSKEAPELTQRYLNEVLNAIK